MYAKHNSQNVFEYNELKKIKNSCKFIQGWFCSTFGSIFYGKDINIHSSISEK